MKILAFETASGGCSVAISTDAEIIATRQIFEHSEQAENLTSMISEILTSTKLALSDIDYIATTNGPGSFTGIRIGLSAALGLSMATNTTPVIVSNLAIINHKIREQYRDFDLAICLIDAFRDEIYMQIFDRYNRPIIDPQLLSIDEAQNTIKLLDKHIICAGSGAAKIQNLANDRVALLPRFPCPDARIICKLAHSQIVKGQFSSLIEPLYIRLPDAKLPNA